MEVTFNRFPYFTWDQAAPSADVEALNDSEGEENEGESGADESSS